ncbi:DUF1501 domain-containing protein [Luteolibacter ambystomatis]|uniref:DUF1501 domain-containing protein n=1 Tax=Luteolibacter ambystomatis TaxID=2824561 RepID=A0A975IZV4_9BACT|nr:DUF1501 domain-containing protein [Luteolibacter ambystomatis]QUE50340.1 DUF1501 domain-containing protein [Luteolibacter ambystomatis]
MKTRRDFLRATLLGASATWTVPMFVENTFAQLHNDTKDLAVQPVTGKDGPILVVIQLAGGNDGLNTLAPFADDAYHKARPRLAKKEKDLIRLSDYCGLNNSMPWLGSQFKEGDLAIVQGVGYPNPNRSHFVSTSIWETADPANRSNTGWLGRYFDNACSGSDPTVGISFSKTQPEAFGAARNPGICLSTPELYRWINGNDDSKTAEEFFSDLNRPDAPVEGGSIAMAAGGKTGAIQGESNLSFLERVALDAQVSSAKILEIASKHKTNVQYDGTPLARSLNLVGRMIAGGLPTRVFYVSHGGFDTHNNQMGTQDRLLGQLDSALKSFMADLKQQGAADRVVVMTFSEFGRRVGENASGGTDHGQGSCLFTLGQGVKGGLYGKYPSLTDLSQGDLKFTTDFRGIYATILENWLKTPSKPILKGAYEKLSFMG